MARFYFAQNQVHHEFEAASDDLGFIHRHHVRTTRCCRQRRWKIAASICGMVLIFTHHVQMRMKQRGISEEDILFVLSAHDFAAPGHDGGTLVVRRFSDGRELKVWISGTLPIRDRAIIKSAAWRD